MDLSSKVTDAEYIDDGGGDSRSAARNTSRALLAEAGRHALAWPRLHELILGREEQARRRLVIGGSDANIILGGSEESLLRLWREKRGECEAEDLSSKLAVVLGCWTEAFNRQWYEKLTGEVVERAGAFLCSPVHPWRGCTLDGFVERADAVWEAKHTSGFMKGEDLLSRYMPQLQHNMAVAGSRRSILSVIFGNGKWEVFEVASDWLYQDELLDAESRFWSCVENGTPPVAMAAPPAPRPVGVREICLEGSNAWAVAAADWLQHREAAKKHAAAVRRHRPGPAPSQLPRYRRRCRAGRSNRPYPRG